jgi:hypothetical protein
LTSGLSIRPVLRVCVEEVHLGPVGASGLLPAGVQGESLQVPMRSREGKKYTSRVVFVQHAHQVLGVQAIRHGNEALHQNVWNCMQHIDMYKVYDVLTQAVMLF